MSGWETLLDRPQALVRRRGRFLVMDLREAHRTISTSVRNGGQVEHVRHLVNHQSCEGTGHLERYRAITEHGQEAYHDTLCAELGLLVPVRHVRLLLSVRLRTNRLTLSSTCQHTN